MDGKLTRRIVSETKAALLYECRCCNMLSNKRIELRSLGFSLSRSRSTVHAALSKLLIWQKGMQMLLKCSRDCPGINQRWKKVLYTHGKRQRK